MENAIASDLSTYQTVPLSDLMRPRFVGGRVALPVASSSPFAHFEHIDGVPTKDGSGFSFNRLQVLDVLIDRLIKMKDQQTLSKVPDDHLGLSNEALDALIDELAQKVQTAENFTPTGLAESLGSTFGMQISQTGAVVSLLA